MLKTVKKFAWLVACTALVFGAVSCSDPEDPETPATSGPATEQPGDSTFESKTETINLAELGVTAVSDPANTDPTVAEVSVNELVVTITSKKAGTTTVTAKLTITGAGETDGEIVITVAADGSIDSEITKPAVPDQGEGDDQGGSDNPATVAVSATWDFATQPAGFPTSDTATDAVTDLVVPVTSGEGASLTATGRWKWVAPYIQAQASSGVTVTDAASCNKYFTLTLEGDASVTLVYQGAGGLDPKRYVAVLDSANQVLFGTPAEGIASGTDLTTTFSLSAGKYKIMMNGSRIFSITCAAAE